MASITVAIAEDREITSRGIQSYFMDKPEYALVDVYPDWPTLLKGLAARPIQILLLDNTLPGTDTINSIRHIRKHWPYVRMMLFGSDLTAALIQTALNVGAMGCMCKAESLQHLDEALPRLMQDNRYFSPQVADLLFSAIEDDNARTISQRLRQVLQLLAQGYSVADISQQLGTTDQAIYHARRRLREALNVHTNEAIVPRAQQLGLLSPDLD